MKLFIIIIFLFFNFSVSANNIFSYKNIHVENEDINSFNAKKTIIQDTINDKFIDLINNLSVNSIESENIFKDIKVENFLKNIVVKNEIVTDKKYIADLDIYFDKNKVIQFYKNNKILFSDTVSPDILILSSYNFDGTNILWEKNNWTHIWKSLIPDNKQLNISLPKLDNKNKILISSSDLFNLNIININNILNYYKLKQAVIITAFKEYDLEDGKMYINLSITFFEINQINNIILENIYNDKILVSDLNKELLLNKLMNISYNKIFFWWKNKTITHFDQINKITCNFKFNNPIIIKKIKNVLRSISQVDKFYISSLNINMLKINIHYFGELNDIIDIFILSNLKVSYESEKCFLIYETI